MITLRQIFQMIWIVTGVMITMVLVMPASWCQWLEFVQYHAIRTSSPSHQIGWYRQYQAYRSVVAVQMCGHVRRTTFNDSVPW